MRRQGDGELSAQPPAALLEQLRCNLRDALKQQACVKVARVGDPGGLLPSGLVRYKSKVGGAEWCGVSRQLPLLCTQ
jgi:hypothetical protein